MIGNRGRDDNHSNSRLINVAARWVHAPLIVVAVILRNEVGRTAYITALCVIAIVQMYMVLRARVAEADLAEAEGDDDTT